MNFAVLSRRRPPPPMSSASCWPSEAALVKVVAAGLSTPPSRIAASCSRPKVLFSYDKAVAVADALIVALVVSNDIFGR
jgi:hypothetical protein